MANTTPKPRRAYFVFLLVGVLLAHAGLLAVIALRNAAVSDEASHLAAGVSIWQHRRFDLYRVNPPLVRLLAAAPVALSGPATDWGDYERFRSQVETRPEWTVGIGFVRKNIDRVQRYFAWARFVCIPFSLVGGYFCWRWAGELYGKPAGAIALLLWCFSPNVIAWSATICPDTAAAAVGVVAGYFFWQWLQEPDWFRALLAGLLFGLAQLTKMTWIILFALWPLIWLIWLFKERPTSGRAPGRLQALQLASLLAAGLWVLNLGYAFEGTLTKLGEFTFVSHTLAGDDSLVDGGRGGNRFADGWLGEVPVPLPSNYVRGIDVQKTDFEEGLPSYLCGQWSDRGWWYYYFVCAALKVPLGTWALGLLAVGTCLKRFHRQRRFTVELEPVTNPAKANGADNGWADALVLLLPAFVLIGFVSSQAGFSRHFRYVLPAFPWLFIWISQVACSAVQRPRTIGVLVAGALTWSVLSSLWVYPHSMSYFNELAGGPKGGHRYLLESNLDWGQDVWYLKEWCQKNPQARPLSVLFRNSFSVDFFGIDNTGEPPPGPAPPRAEPSPVGSARLRENASLRENRISPQPHESKPQQRGPQPGWYACSIQRIHDPQGEYLYFLRFTPCAMAGYSTYLYHITQDEADRVRQELGLPESPAAGHASPSGSGDQ